ncbi:alpha/beta hydrolase [Mycobacterium cookii]|uniref:Carboxylesterase LipQ n=1 Tax=Mycobacterium cookii TaxID=1775 RepID=A0A7I7KTV3_9MYCO|nr:alpha/beta hydrolase [Mycobacterium cookii]MCV7329044.1 alpha/beta hydrolase [Mycobacterium cookii]BBX45540.1 carboxylesterase LipQ [Mycobacterium cookii]
MTIAMDVRARYSQACAEMLRHGVQLAATPIGAYRTGSLLLRGSPTVAGFVAGWLSAEFPPHVVTGHALSGVAPLSIRQVATNWAAQRADRVLTAALQDSLGAEYRDSVHHPIDPRPERRGGVLHSARAHRRYAKQTSDIPYGPDTRDNLLDIWRHRDIKAGDRAPVLLQIPGGAWTVNGRRPQGYPLLGRMAELGWVCVSIDYSKSPRKTWPAHIIDVKRALAWVRDNIADYGGDPDFIAVTGGSAGGHLASLVALTANDPRLQPGFEDADTTVQAAAPYYGVYDLTDAAKMHEMMLPFVELFVMKERYADKPELFELASPISHVHSDAPPFFVLHGESDSVIPNTQARAFCAALRGAGAATVGYAELPNAHHAFDLFATVRSRLTADAVADFMGVVYGQHVRSQAGAVREHATPAG